MIDGCGPLQVVRHVADGPSSNVELRPKERAVIAALPASTRSGKGKGGVTKAWLVAGIAAQDLYHAGQIQLLKRLSKG